MKEKVILVVLSALFLAATGCTTEKLKKLDEKREAKQEEMTRSNIYTQEHDGHMWVCWTKKLSHRLAASGFKHHPDCPCQKSKDGENN